MEVLQDILHRLYEMTALAAIWENPLFLVMYLLAFVLLYLGIVKKYEPLLLVPIAFGVLIANFPGGGMGVVQANSEGMVMVNGELKSIYSMPLHEIAHDLGLMNYLYYALIKSGLLPPVIFMGVGAAVPPGLYIHADRIGLFDPFFCTQCKGMQSGFALKVVEFDHFKVWVVHNFPCSQEFQRCAGAKPVFNHISSATRIGTGFRHIRQTDKVFFVDFHHGDGRFLYGNERGFLIAAHVIPPLYQTLLADRQFRISRRKL